MAGAPILSINLLLRFVSFESSLLHLFTDSSLCLPKSGRQTPSFSSNGPRGKPRTSPVVAQSRSGLQESSLSVHDVMGVMELDLTLGRWCWPPHLAGLHSWHGGGAHDGPEGVVLFFSGGAGEDG